MSDKFVHIVISHDPNLYVPFFRSQVVAAALEGVIYVAKNSDGLFVGVAIWFGPGQEMWQTSALSVS